MKVGGHMASATSLSTILTALYCDVMGPDDRLAVKVREPALLFTIH